MSFLPLTPAVRRRCGCMTIAGSDSGGGAGIQADMRTFALLGMHGCVAVTAVTVQNSMGVKGFHEIPVDVIAGQIEAVACDIGIQAAKTGMLASSDIIATIADTWRAQGLARRRCRWSSIRCARRCTATHYCTRARWIRFGAELFPLATLVTPNLDEVRLLVDIDVVDDASQREAARALHALGPQWALVKGGHLRSSPESPDLLYDGTDFYEFGAPRIDTGDDHGAGDTLAAAAASALAHGYTGARRGGVRQVVGDRMSARRLPVGPRPRPGVAAVPVSRRPSVNLDDIAGIAHEPDGKPKGAVVLTHGAGGSRESAMLKRICDEWARRGWLAVRYNLPYRRRRPKGRRRVRRPPTRRASSRRSGSVARAGHGSGHRGRPFLRRADDLDGGRRRRGARRRADAVLLSAAPTGQARKRPHRTPAAHRGADGVHPRHRPTRSARIDELRAAAALIAGATEIVEITGARHDLGSKTLDVPVLAVDAALRLLRDHAAGHYQPRQP